MLISGHSGGGIKRQDGASSDISRNGRYACLLDFLWLQRGWSPCDPVPCFTDQKRLLRVTIPLLSWLGIMPHVVQETHICLIPQSCRQFLRWLSSCPSVLYWIKRSEWIIRCAVADIPQLLHCQGLVPIIHNIWCPGRPCRMLGTHICLPTRIFPSESNIRFDI